MSNLTRVFRSSACAFAIVACLAAPTMAAGQDTDQNTTEEAAEEETVIIVTGSRIQ